MFLVWFVSGVVMMYWRMPTLTAEERLVRLPALDLSQVRVAAADAAHAAGVSPDRFRVGTMGDRVVYRFLSGGKWTVVFADTGEPLRGVSADQALDVVRRFIPEHAATIQYDAYLTDSDQWTLDGGLRLMNPLHRIALGDPAGTHVYVSERTSEVVVKTDAKGRFWGYLGAVLYWTYFTPFRRHATLWAQSIIYAALIGCVMCLSGLVVGIWRYSLNRRFRLKGVRSHSPYAGLMWWHHYAGLAFGLFTFTWALSGAFSLNPWSWAPGTGPTRQQILAVSGGPLRLDQLAPDRIRRAVDVIRASFTPKELEILQFRGEPIVMAYQVPSADEASRVDNIDLRAYLSPALRLEHRMVWARAPERGAFTRLDDDAVLTAAKAAMPSVAVEGVTWLDEYDSYYYDRRATKPLPILRVQYADPRRTWLYLDPHHGLIALKHERLSRLNRWLYHGLHNLDFPFLYYARPTWDIVVIVLSLGGVLLSVTTMTAAWRRLRRHARHLAYKVGEESNEGLKATRGVVSTLPLPRSDRRASQMRAKLSARPSTSPPEE